MKKNYLRFSLLLVIPFSYGIRGQDGDQLSNKVSFSIGPGTIVSSLFDFSNLSTRKVTNDGTFYFYKNFSNEGNYTFSSSGKGKSVFSHYLTGGGVKTLSGAHFSEFYNVDFDSSSGIDLQKNIEISGEANFIAGIVKIDKAIDPNARLSKGMVSFMLKAHHQNVDDSSYVDGPVEKKGKESFVYPIGKDNKFRPSKISAPGKDGDLYVSEYFYDDASLFSAKPHGVGAIKQIDTKEYWLIDRGESKSSDVLITLSWDERTTPLELLTNAEDELDILRWDEQQQLWVDEGGVIEMSSKTVTTVGSVKNYGFFTFGTIKKDWAEVGDVVIYNLVIPNGDGKNDYFTISNIHHYPNNKVEIYNRWRDKVNETTHYDPAGDGSVNVFTGYSDGRVTIDKSKKLPSGTYYYVVTYEYTDASDSRMIKKAANLHLETN